MPIYEFEGKRPVIAESAFIHPEAVIIGDVQVGKESYIGPGAVLRGDTGRIIIGQGTSIQDNVVIHTYKDTCAIIEDNVLVGHSALVHGPCLIKEWAWIGQGANVVGNSEVGTASVLAAGSVLPPGHSIPAQNSYG